MKKNTKQHIIEASADLFSRKGYNGTSISDIMKATGLKKGGIYNHFKNKDELALEAFDYAGGLVFKRFRAELDKCTTSWDKLMTIIDVFAGFEQNPVVGIGCPIYNMAVDTRESHPVLNARSRETLQILKRYIEIKIEEGIDRKEFSTLIPPTEISLLLMVTLEGAMIYSRLNIGENALQIVALRMKEILKNQLIDKD